MRSKRSLPDAELGRDRLRELWTRGPADDGLGDAPGRRRERLPLGAALERREEQPRLLPDRDLGVWAPLPHVGERLDDRGLAADEVLLADGELLLDPPALGVLDPLRGVVDGVHDGVGEPALAVLQAEDERGGVDLQVDPHRWTLLASDVRDLLGVLVDGLEGEPAPRHLDECHGPGGVGGVALEPLVDGLVGDAQVRVAGQAPPRCGTRRSRAPSGRTRSAQRSRGSLEPAAFKRLVSKHRHPLDRSSYVTPWNSRLYRFQIQRGAGALEWGHLDKGRGAGWVGGMAFEPLVHGLVGDAEVMVVGHPTNGIICVDVGRPGRRLALAPIGSVKGDSDLPMDDGSVSSRPKRREPCFVNF